MKRLIAKVNEIPQELYHATYLPYLESIMKYGLGAKGKKNWEDSVKGVVYLANQDYLAEEYAETAELADDDLLDQIVVLRIDPSQLDPNQFSIDSNVILEDDEEPTTFEYRGVIPPSALTVIKGA